MFIVSWGEKLVEDRKSNKMTDGTSFISPTENNRFETENISTYDDW